MPGENLPDGKRIYIVDDEPDLRTILQAVLQHIEPKWRVETFADAAGALAACEREFPHLIISDQNMPKITGTEMFDLVRQRHPETLRILISGHASTANKISSAQQYLAKPFDMKGMAEIVRRALNAQETLGNPGFARLVGSLNSFPALPKNCTDLLRELDSEADSATACRLISEDGGVLTRALQMANSPLFYGHTMARSAGAALSLLGTRNMRALVLSVHVFHGYEDINLPEISCSELWHHCRQTAAIAEELAKEHLRGQDVGDVFFASLVHDLGRLILMENRRDEYAEACRRALTDGATIEAVESRLFGKNNTELASFMLRLWGMPEPVCRAVTNHLEPWRHTEEKTVTPTTILYVANYLARQAQPPDPFVTPPINREYLDSVGFVGTV